jgi:hypothetical protein
VLHVSHEIAMYTATPHIGHGIDTRSLEQALSWGPEVVVAQGTSTDPGPYYLGTGTSYMQRREVKRDLRMLITACRGAGVLFIVSVGGAGDNRTLERDLATIDEIAREESLELSLAVIRGEVSHEWLRGRLAAGATARRLVDTPFLEEELSAETIDASVRIVAQMGPEPVVEALRSDGIHGVVTGRALDVGLFVAVPLLRGADRSEAMHFATIMHDGALACVPGSGSDGLFGRLGRDGFEITTPNPARRCTPVSVAGMSFYERPNPFVETMPGGSLDVSGATYEALDDRTVRVSGARWTDAVYTVKIEGAALQGHRAIALGGSCDPIFLGAVDEIIEGAHRTVSEIVRADTDDGAWQLAFRVYGRDALRNGNGAKGAEPVEVGILIDVLADDPEVASGVCSTARSALLHQAYPGRRTTAGNLAIPFSPVELSAGPSYRYNIWHALELDDPLEPFPYEVTTFPRTAR